MEIERPNQWLEPGWLLLTTGLRFVGRDDAVGQAELIGELKDGHAAGLAFGVGVNFEQVPQALVSAATDVGLTLLTVAAEVPFAAVENYVNRSLAASEAYVAKRALWIQTELLQSLSAEQPLMALVNQIGRLIRGIAVIYDDAGAMIAATGAVPGHLIWEQIRCQVGRRQRFAVGRWQVAARPTAIAGMNYWIAIGSQQAHVLDNFADPLLDSVQRLLGAIQSTTAFQATEARAEVAELLTLLSGVIAPAEAPPLWERLAALRFPMHAPLRVFVSAKLADRTISLTTASEDLNQFVEDAQAHHLPLILKPRGATEAAGWVGIARDSTVFDSWSDKLGESQLVGVSEPFTDLTLGRRSFREARRALLVAQRSAAQRGGAWRHASNQSQDMGTPPPPGPLVTGCVVRFEDVDLATWLLSSRSAEAIADKSRQQLGDLLDRSDLVDTAVAYLACGLDIQRTAARLYLHPNSVRYRLRRIEQTIEAPLSAPSALANLYLAFHDRLAAENPGPEGETQYQPPLL
ncbi:MAG: helix-turn-helix domain-containing protein, partial [Micrococcales bacterium]|nr:helix-turn-helix domain-containing protein [Micrococcales bacterium]